MLLIYLFLQIFRPVAALPAADLDFVVIDRFYSSFLGSSQIIGTQQVKAGYGDFVLLTWNKHTNIQDIKPGVGYVRIYSDKGRQNGQSHITSPGFLLLFVRDTAFVDVLDQDGLYHVVFNRRRRLWKPPVFLGYGQKPLTVMAVRHPARRSYIFARQGSVYAQIGRYYFLFKDYPDSLVLYIIPFASNRSRGKRIVFGSHNTFSSSMVGQVKKSGNELVIGKDTFMTRINDSALVNYGQWDTTAILKIHYATSRNFTHTRLYPCARCLLRYKAARDLYAASRQFADSGYRLVLFDCYRPLSVQRRMWEVVHNINYVAPPSKKSSHNRGAAIDVSIADSRGNLLDMGTGFDYFGPRAGNDYTGLTEEQKHNRHLLQSVLARHNFLPIRTEWWHFYHVPSIGYKALDIPLPCGKK